MAKQMLSYAVLCVVSLAAGAGCQRDDRRQPPPAAQRPVLKSEAELASERAERIRTGQVVPTNSPVIVKAERTAPSRRPLPPVQPTAGAIEADILMVNDSVLTMAEVLYPLREEFEEIRQTQTPAGFRERIRQRLRREIQREIGSLLINAEAVSNLSEQQVEILAKVVDKEIENLTTREFGGSSARLTAHLTESELTLEQFRAAVQRDLVVRQYTREKLMPLIQIPRFELLHHYRRNMARYETAETRELLLIEFPFEKFLPVGQTWARVTKTERASAKLAAVRRAREAHAALAEKPFEEVAREYGLGLHAEQGGSWGPIGRPLQPPYDEVSRLIFGYEEGQQSKPIETGSGWYIVQCGRVNPAQRQSFVDVQDEIRQELMERRFTKLSVEYVLDLAEKATISSLDLFINAGVKRAEEIATRTEGG